MKNKNVNRSRRNFAKSAALALSTVPLGSVMAANNVQQGSQTRQGQGKFRTHDTPPPVTFENGSFVLERIGEFQNDDVVTVGDRKEYRHRPFFGSVVNPAHIKIADGSGEILYRNDNADACLITMEVALSSGVSKVNAQRSPDSSRFVIDVDKNHQLEKGNSGNHDVPTSNKRTRRYRHSHAQGINSVTISDGTATLYSLNLGTLVDGGQDFKIMIWLEPA